ncbi:DUF4255 domain-containing protein [Pseudomonas sp. WJP1]|uniref:DUF4255 domain-containing protein n=1 Tax=Pseudomonas sp. WJP1 TaxID=2986947 RepID=UPI0023491CCF|nr:DUF4255 domain-containing protein [Pseudomonas sp. WJP1]WCM54375.1 DUF4255 domain-containing protein [Pseudomonas sp. WJP1]
MSSPLGLAAALATLQQMLEVGFADMKISDVLGGAPSVTCVAPDRIDTNGSSDQLNIFLYNQMRNLGWTNLGLPGRDSSGERIGNPPLALDLYVLITAYGVADFHAEILLGAAMQVLHDIPGMGRDAIREALKPNANKPHLPKALELAGLADQVEQLRVTPLNLSADEVSRIWSAIQLPARPSAAYLISVVLQSTARSQRTPLPVLARNLYAMPLRAPRVDRVESVEGASIPIVPDGSVRVSGMNLKAQPMCLLVNGLDLSAALNRVDNEVLEFGFLLPDPPHPPALPASLRAGVCTLLVSHGQLMGTPPTVHGAIESNLGVFILNPQAIFTVLPGAISMVIDGVTFRAGALKVTCTPPLGARQRVRLLLNEKNPPSARPARAYSFNASEGNGISWPDEQADAVTIEYQGVVQGAYLARVQVDTGTSALTQGMDGQFDGPEVAP